MQSRGIEFDFFLTKYEGHAFKLAIENLKEYYKIVAVGGDGTVNEISKALIYKDNLFGIIPTGSGNGLARSLKIPKNLKKAINKIIKGNTIKIDSGKVNDHHFLNVAGIGFDAQIAHTFTKSKKRGFKTYFLHILREFINYKPTDVIIEKDDREELKISPFLVSIANSQQWGNNAYISPSSKINDGLFEICVLKKFPLIITPVLVVRLFLKNIHKSKYMKTIQADSVVIKLKTNSKGHIDGEPVVFDKILNIKILKKSINIIV